MKNHKLLKFEANWCAPCKYMAPIVENVLSDNVYSDLRLICINIDDESSQEAIQQFGIRSIPTLILLDDNDQIINKLIGSANAEQIKEFLSKQ